MPPAQNAGLILYTIPFLRKWSSESDVVDYLIFHSQITFKKALKGLNNHIHQNGLC